MDLEGRRVRCPAAGRVPTSKGPPESEAALTARSTNGTSEATSRADLRLLGSGEFRISAQDEAGTLLGYGGVRVDDPADESPAAEETPPLPAITPTPAPVPEAIAPARASTSAGVGAADGWLLGLGAVVLAGTGLALRRRLA